jgi:hypothetical protein
LALIARRLLAAVGAYDSATSFILKNAQESLRAVFLGSVPFMLLAGVVNAGWHLARAALVCSDRAEAGTGSPFYTQKFATCVFYAAHILPRAEYLSQAVLEGNVAMKYASIATRI